MKLLFTFLSCVLYTTIFFAQSPDPIDDINPEWHQSGDIQFGVLAGYTTNILSEGNNFNEDTDISGNGFLVGARANYFFGKNWSLRGGLNFEKRDFGSGISSNYIAVPLIANWHFGKNRRWHLALGAAYSASLDGDLESGIGTDFSIGVIIPISNTKFFIELDGVTQNDATIVNLTDANGNPIGTGSLNSNRSSLTVGVLF